MGKEMKNCAKDGMKSGKKADKGSKKGFVPFTKGSKKGK